MQESVDDVVIQVLCGGLCWPESIHVRRPDDHCGASWLGPFVDVPCRLFHGQHVSRCLLLLCGESEVRMANVVLTQIEEAVTKFVNQQSVSSHV